MVFDVWFYQLLDGTSRIVFGGVDGEIQGSGFQTERNNLTLSKFPQYSFI